MNLLNPELREELLKEEAEEEHPPVLGETEQPVNQKVSTLLLYLTTAPYQGKKHLFAESEEEAHSRAEPEDHQESKSQVPENSPAESTHSAKEQEGAIPICEWSTTNITKLLLITSICASNQKLTEYILHILVWSVANLDIPGFETFSTPDSATSHFHITPSDQLLLWLASESGWISLHPLLHPSFHINTLTTQHSNLDIWYFEPFVKPLIDSNLSSLNPLETFAIQLKSQQFQPRI